MRLISRDAITPATRTASQARDLELQAEREAGLIVGLVCGFALAFAAAVVLL